VVGSEEKYAVSNCPILWSLVARLTGAPACVMSGVRDLHEAGTCRLSSLRVTLL